MLDAALPMEASGGKLGWLLFFSSYLLSFHSFLLPVLALGVNCPAGLEIFSLSLSCCFSTLWHKMSVLLKERCCPPPIALCGCWLGLRGDTQLEGTTEGFGAWGRWDAQSRCHPALWLSGLIFGGKVELASPNGIIWGIFGDGGGVRMSAPSLCPMALLSTWNTEI